MEVVYHFDAMSLELTVLGSGCAAPEPGGDARNPAGFAVRAGRDLLLFDLGFGNLRQLVRAGLDPADVGDVFLSHRHPDHCGDVPALLFHFRCEAKPASGRLRLWGPAGTSALVEALSAAWRPWLDPRGYELEIRELKPGDGAAGADWELRSLAALHPTPALAYRLSRGGADLVYSGDCAFTPELVSFAKDCGLLAVEATCAGSRALPGHMTARQALRVVRDSGCRRALLTHLSAASAAAAERLLHFQPNARLAADLLREKIPSTPVSTHVRMMPKE